MTARFKMYLEAGKDYERMGTPISEKRIRTDAKGVYDVRK